MRTLTALAAAAALGLVACAREADTPGDAASNDTSHEMAEAGEAVGEAAVQVGQAARVAVTNAAETVQENADESTDENKAAEPASPSSAAQP